VTASEIETTAGSLGAVQLDAVNVVDRSQFLVLFSRLGPFDRSLLYGLSSPGGALWEYWGHAASLMPVADEPLFRWRYRIGGTYVPGPKVGARIGAWEAAFGDYLEAVLKEVGERGPLTAAQLSDPRPRKGEWWDRRSDGRQALAWLHGRGRLASWRSVSFESQYDLPERVLPPEVQAVPTPSVEEAQRSLLMKAARASGVGTVNDIAGYYMIQPRIARPLIADLVRAGQLVRVDIEGWTEPGYMPADNEPRRPTRPTGTLLSPFDSLIWDRARTSRLFDFQYRIEVYVPEPKRVHGYYVLPLIVGDKLVARLDLKADRKSLVLRVAGCYGEPGIDTKAVAATAITELDTMRAWLGLDHIVISPKGDLAPALGQQLKKTG
jgi:hypothetical protein